MGGRLSMSAFISSNQRVQSNNMESGKFKKQIGITEARKKIERFCAYQERSQWEVKKRLIEYGLPYGDVDALLVELIRSNFLNEERFVRAYVKGKFSMKGWGVNKIKQGLKMHAIADRLISAVIAELEQSDYKGKLLSIAQKKWPTIKANSIFEKKGKLQRFLIGKGYEYAQIESIMHEFE